MDGKITLITPPDFYENENQSFLFCHLDDNQQDIVSKWLSKTKLTDSLNFYVYTNEVDLAWLFYAFNRCEYKYINFDKMNSITHALGGYMLGKNNVYYNTKDQNLVSIFSYINNNRITDIEQFLERALIDQRSKSSV